MSLAGKHGDGLLDALIFARGTQVDCVWAGGAKRVEGGRHLDREAVGRRFRAAMDALSGGET